MNVFCRSAYRLATSDAALHAEDPIPSDYQQPVLHLILPLVLLSYPVHPHNLIVNGFGEVLGDETCIERKTVRRDF